MVVIHILIWEVEDVLVIAMYLLFGCMIRWESPWDLLCNQEIKRTNK
jgi:hypothetical protein